MLEVALILLLMLANAPTSATLPPNTMLAAVMMCANSVDGLGSLIDRLSRTNAFGPRAGV